MNASELRKIADNALNIEETNRVVEIHSKMLMVSKAKKYEVTYGASYISDRMAKYFRDQEFKVSYFNSNCIISW